mgnify:CR=1 FL=1
MTAAIVGARHPYQIEETIVAGDWELSKEDIVAIDEMLEKHQEELLSAGKSK